MIQKNTIWFDEYNLSGDYEKATRQLKKSEPEFIIKWIKTDAWRGYFEARAKRGTGWKKIDEIDNEKLAGWITGEWSDAPHGTKGSELAELLKKLKVKEAKIIFLPTSNVFSTAYDLFVR